MNIDFVMTLFVDALETIKRQEDEKMPPLYYAVCILNNNESFKLIANGGRIYIYHKGTYWSISTKDKTMDFVKRCILKIDSVLNVSVRLVSKVLDELFMQYRELTPYVDENATYINMRSNVLVIYKDGSIKTVEHDEKYNFTYKLPYDYDAEATSPVFDKFLQTSLGDVELIDVIGEYLGYVLSNNSKNYEKALFMYGDGSNGKSTLINITKALFGAENISFVELSEMGDMLKCALMDGKLLNISSDAKKNGLDTSAFKKIVSGEVVLGKYLFKDIYTIDKLPKLLVAMNKLPFNNGDNSHGFYRRLLLVPFNVTIKEEDKDYEIHSKMLLELPAILNFAIDGMKRLIKQGSFTEAKAIKELMTSYKESSNYVTTFLEEEQYKAVDPSAKTGTKLLDIFREFKSWCLERGYNPYSEAYLSSELNHLGYIAYKNSSKHYRIIKGKLKNATGFQELENNY